MQAPLPADASFLVYVRLDRERFDPRGQVMLDVCVKNVSSQPQSFTIYSGGPEIGDYLTFQPAVYNSQGNEAESIVPYRMKGQALKDIAAKVQARSITLEPGEIFTRAVDLNSLYRLEHDVHYRVRSFFLPDLLTQQQVHKSTNELSFIVSARGMGNMKSGVIREKRPMDVDRTMSPSEVVVIHLLAEKNRDREKFIKYIDVPKYINSYSDYVKVYQSADNDEKRTIEEDFVAYLSRERGDYLLDFTILQEEVEKNRKISYVDAVAERFGPRRSKKYRYRFTLEKDNLHWLITGLEATILKGSAR
jgi:hypothetical protein